MGRGPKPVKSKAAKPPVARKGPKDEGARVRDLEKRLADALKGKAETLERETAALKRASDALEQQTATSEILKVISRSPTDLQPVLDAVASSAARLCDSLDASIFRVDGDIARLMAHKGPISEVDRGPVTAVGYLTPTDVPIVRGTVIGRAIIERRAIQVADLQAENQDFPEGSARARRIGWRTQLSVPLLRERGAIGVIALRRIEARPFSDSQIALLQTFADQAVIAIENVRLFNETKEALEQQTASSEILQVISRSPTDVQPVFDMITERAARLCESRDAVMFRVDGDILRLVASYGSIETIGHGGTLPIDERTGSGRAVVTQQPVHIPDLLVAEAEFPEGAALARRQGYRTALSVPLLRDGLALGAIMIRRAEVRPFTELHAKLLQTFANQAVIAIENVRLFTELQEKNNALTQAHAQVTESLEQQTATSEILRVISSSPTDVKPVFEAVAESAVRLCEAHRCSVLRVEGDVLHYVARCEVTSGRQVVQIPLIEPLGEDSLPARTIRERRIIQISDVQNDPLVPPKFREMAHAGGYRALMVIPMLRDYASVGAIALMRPDPIPFTERHVDLVKTFADQAVIAIENVRLFNETKEALERQTATSEILRVISQSPTDLQPVMDTVAKNAARLCNAIDAQIFRLEEGVQVRVASYGSVPSVLARATPPNPRLVSGRAILERRTIHVHDLALEIDREYPDAKPLQQTTGQRTTLATPLLRQRVAIGVILIRRLEVRPFTEKEIGLLETFADQAVIAIENVRLFKELQTRNHDLTEALDRQISTAAILGIISRVQTDLQPVFAAITESATRLCGGTLGALARTDGERIFLDAFYPPRPEGAQQMASHAYPRPLDNSSLFGRAMVERRIVHVPDLQDPAAPQSAGVSLAAGARSQLTVPMLRDGQPIGAITVTRSQPGAFTDAHIALLRTFADQAVIAIENARLLSELRARTAELTRSVGELRALGEVGRAVSSTLDLETVLTTIVSRAVQLSGLDGGVVFEYDDTAEEFVHRVATEGGGVLAETRRATRVRKGEGVVGQTAVTREPAQVQDIAIPGAYESRLRENLIASGIRAILAVPMVREDELIGCLVVSRNAPGDFPLETIDLLRTFATQSALAIQNARLFREIEEKSRQLEVASQHKSEFLANMSHELRTPLNAIIGFSEVLSEKMFGELNEKQEEYLKDIYASGNHLLSLINDILDLSKIEAGRMELELSGFHLPTALDSALTLVRERAGRRSIALHLRIDERLGQIQADERKVRQVVLNLLSNAIKFTPEGGRIEVSSMPRDGSVEVSVSDTGVGIAPEDQEAVFEEFRQVGTADKKIEGTGLGLTLCRKFVELHGGKIWVKSELGAGSTFTFTIPVRRGQ